MSDSHFIKIVKKINLFYPFTLIGSSLFVAAFIILGISFTTRNTYGFLLSAFSIIFLSLLALVAKLQEIKFSTYELIWDSSSSIYSKQINSDQKLILNNIKPFLFYRIHFVLAGRLQVDRECHINVFYEFSSSKNKEIPLTMYFPFCGVFFAKGSFKIQDVFGLTKATFKSYLHRSINILPGILPDKVFTLPTPAGGSENKNRFKQSDLERYYTRDYISGDRLRDINWKASNRYSQLFTRISPTDQNKTKLITILFRPFKKQKKTSIETLVHLDYIKSWLYTFLLKIKDAHPEYIFKIHCPSNVFDLKTNEDIIQFANYLCPLPYSPDSKIPGDLQEVETIYVFSTDFDDYRELSSEYNNRKIILFKTSLEDINHGSSVRINLFSKEWAGLIPGSWIFRRTREIKNYIQKGAYEKIYEDTLQIRFFKTQSIDQKSGNKIS